MTTAFDVREEIARACAESAVHHDRLCPRQVLGVRMGLAGAHALGIEVPQREPRLLVFAETDGCCLDGVSAATGCTVGHRTLRVFDYGRVAITAVDRETSSAVRIAPAPDVRERAWQYAPGEHRRYYAQLEGYQRMPEEQLLSVQPVTLTFDLSALIGRSGVRVDCTRCGEEVLNGRETLVDGQPVCPACREPAYYSVAP